MSVDGGGSRDLAILNVRKGGFAKGSTITVDQGRGVLRTRARAGRVRSLEVMAIFSKDERWRFRGTPHNDDLFIQGGRSLEAVMRGGRTPSSAHAGRIVLDLGTGRGDFANGRQGRTPASAPSGSGAARTCGPAGQVEPRSSPTRGHARRSERLERGAQVVPRLPLEEFELHG